MTNLMIARLACSGRCVHIAGAARGLRGVQIGAAPPVVRHREQRRSAMAAVIGTKQDMLSTPGVHRSPDTATKDFINQQTMLRITDAEKSLDFYTRVMGMTLLLKLDFPDSKFSLFFLGYHAEADIPEDPAERVAWTFRQTGTLELTYNHGAESDGTKYHSGNEEPKGFGHIGIAVPDVYAACERFEKLGVPFQKTPDGGSMKGIAFIKCPDGYWIEILSPNGMRDFAA